VQRKYEVQTVAELTGAETPMADAEAGTGFAEEVYVGGADDAAAPAEFASDYTVESPGLSTRMAARPVLTGHAGATGRRKEAIARVRVLPGTGQWKINSRVLADYFPNKVHQQLVNEPFVTLGAESQFDVIARISGGGVTGQAGALRLGIARALTEIDPDNRPALKKAGFLTRDARVKERKKYGLKKARKAPQYSKR
jgi:small subunit ribosomal protein S9